MLFTHAKNSFTKGLAVLFFALTLVTTLAPVQLTVSPEKGLQVAFIQTMAQEATTEDLANNGGVETDQCSGQGELKPWDIATKIKCVLMDALGRAVLQIGASITWISGIFLDISIERTVLEMGAKMNDTSGLGGAVNDGWTLVRDICNLAFIFGFIYLGFRAIFYSDDAQVKKFLSRIIIGALFINFSLFFAQAIIDVSNILAIEVYNVIVKDGSITETLFDQLGLVTIYNAPLAEQLEGIGRNGSLWYYIMVSIMLLIAAFTFFSAAILFVIRFVYLVLIMIGSPILFAAMVFPQTDKISADLWRKLINYSIFAPVYLLLIYVSIRVVGSLGVNTDPLSKSFLEGRTASTSDITINYAIAIFFFIGSVVIAKRAGIAGADTVINAGQGLRKKAQSFVGRNTAGRASGWGLKQYDKLDAKMNNSKGGRFARGLISTASFGALGDRSVRGTLQGGKDAKFGGSYSRSDDVEHKQKRSVRNTQEIGKMERSKKLEEIDAVFGNEEVEMEKLTDAIKNLGKTISSMSDEERADLGFEKLSSLRVAATLNDKNIESLEKSGKYSKAQIDEIKEVRKKAKINIAETGDAEGGENDISARLAGDVANATEQRRNLLKGSAQDIGKLPPEVFADANMQQHLMPSMIEARMKEGLSNQEMEKIQTNMQDYMVKVDTKKKKAWRNWTEKTTYGAQFELDVDGTQHETVERAGQEQQEESGPQIAIASSGADITRARDARNNQNQN